MSNANLLDNINSVRRELGLDALPADRRRTRGMLCEMQYKITDLQQALKTNPDNLMSMHYTDLQYQFSMTETDAKIFYDFLRK